MKNGKIFIQLAIIIIGFLLISCENQKKENVKNGIFKKADSYKKINLQYTIDDSVKDTLKVSYRFLNKSQDTIYYLNNSCYGLLYHFKFKNIKGILIYPFDCNESWPIIGKILPGMNEEFKLNYKVFDRDRNKKIKIGVHMIFSEQNIPYKKLKEDKNSYDYYNGNIVEASRIIWGNKVKER